MKDDRPYWNMEIEPKFNTPEMREIQEIKLRGKIKALREGAPYYTRLFKQCGVNEKTSFEELRRAMPVFTKADWRELVKVHNGDIMEAMNQIIPVNAYEDLYLIASTTGTTGEPEPYPFTQKDLWDVYGEALARYNWRAGLRSGDRVLHCFALSMVIAGIPTLIGAFKLGCMVIPVGAEGGTERILKTAGYYKPTALMGTPSLALYLIEKVPEALGTDVGKMGIKTILCGGEPGAGLPEVRRRIESAFGCKLFDVGGALGISCDHQEYQGLHQVGDDLMILDLVDPDTKEPLPFENGRKGEMVMTCIDGDAFGGAFRRSPGDIIQIFTDPCPCGRSGFRYKIVGRVDDMLKVKGVMVYPDMIRKVIESFVPRVTGQFRIVLDEPPPRVVPPLKLKVEHGADIPENKLEGLASEIAEAMSKDIKIRPEIIWVSPNELERSTYKGKVFEKTYEKK
jgi:phenylacetate-CoA ligase